MKIGRTRRGKGGASRKLEEISRKKLNNNQGEDRRKKQGKIIKD